MVVAEQRVQQAEDAERWRGVGGSGAAHRRLEVRNGGRVEQERGRVEQRDHQVDQLRGHRHRRRLLLKR